MMEVMTGMDSDERLWEARLVADVRAGVRLAENELYAYCADYFWRKYRGVFFVGEEEAAEIFQDAFIALWEHIERGRLVCLDGNMVGKNGAPLTCSILTYFMGIARIKYLEWVREHPTYADPETEMGRKIKEEGFDAQQYINMLYDSEDNKMLDIIADVISHMSERCCEILSKFYYEEKDLDTILDELPTIGSKNALKTKKYKCMEGLRNAAKEVYHKYLNEE